MTQFDLPLAELETYRGIRHEPPGFDAFWARTLDETRRHPLMVDWRAIDTGLALLETFDVTFPGFGGEPIRGWLLLPRGGRGPLPVVVRYVGYGGGRGHPFDHVVWPAAGYAHFVMDTRGQGSAWSLGATPDPTDRAAAGPHYPGFVTRGILDPEQYYYRRLYADAVRAIEAARSHPAVDPERVVVLGGSQGGGMALAAAALVPDVAAALIDVPFLSDVRRAIAITDELPYAELARYLAVHRVEVATALATIDHVDGLNLAPRAAAPALFSVGLMDQITPPSTVFAAYNEYGGPKEIRVLPYSGHDAGDQDHVADQLAFLARLGIVPEA